MIALVARGDESDAIKEAVKLKEWIFLYLGIEK